MDLSKTIEDVLKSLNLNHKNSGSFGENSYQPIGEEILLDSYCPINNQKIASVYVTSDQQYDLVVEQASEVFLQWRSVPAPFRGEIIRQIGEKIREKKESLAKLITLETGKIFAESLGEVQEAIDMADFAVGLSRQLYGKIIQSERFEHRMYEQWHPLGIVGVITAFNFPMAVWAWNAMIAAVCGDVIIWKPSEQAPLCALAINNIAREVAQQYGYSGVFSLIIDEGHTLGQKIANDRRFSLVSATGSCRMGKSVAETVAKRMGKYLLELGGNNAIVVLNDANLDLVTRAILFAAVGTAGQRCTTVRRLLVQSKVKQDLTQRLISAYKQVKVGNPLEKGILMGPLVNHKAVTIYNNALEQIKKQGGNILFGGKVLDGMPSDLYVTPTIVQANANMPIVKEETFAPILYIIEVNSLEEAISINNDVPQGLSSAIFTESLKSAERFLSPSGSDCGIANVNIGTSGAEIGGAFGGEKDTGGGREAGSDAWKQYMRRQTVTINWSNDLPLAQGIKFS